MTTPTASSIQPSGYHVFTDGGYLCIEGETRREFLQRQTTNHIDLLQPERSLLTVLTSATARILDVLILLEDGDAVGMITLPGRGAATAQFLKRRIFFNDKVSVRDESSTVAQIELFGPLAEAALEKLGLPGPLDVNGVAAGDHELRIVRPEPAFGLGYRLLLPIGSLQAVEASLSAAGLERVSSGDYHTLRVEAGLPSAGHELTEDYTPLEVGLLAAISSTKGCYTGQEIIARQITYDKVTRLLCGLRLSEMAAPGAELKSQDDTPAGRLTSVTDSPRLGPIGLGVIKRPYNKTGEVLRAGSAVAQVTPLPFPR